MGPDIEALRRTLPVLSRTAIDGVAVGPGRGLELEAVLEPRGPLAVRSSVRHAGEGNAPYLIALAADLPPSLGTLVERLAFGRDESRFVLPAGTWRVRLALVYEESTVTRAGPWYQVEIRPDEPSELELSWPPERRGEVLVTGGR